MIMKTLIGFFGTLSVLGCVAIVYTAATATPSAPSAEICFGGLAAIFTYATISAVRVKPATAIK